MSKQASPAKIGAFVVGAVALVVAGILVFGSGKIFKKFNQHVVFFDGSVKGLNVGSPVVFRGVKIGEVKEIGLQFSATDLSVRIPVYFEVEEGRFELIGLEQDLERHDLGKELFQLGLRAQLQLQSLVTGQLMVEMDFHPGSPIRMVGTKRQGVVEIPSIPTKFQQLSKTIEKIPLDEIVENVKGVLEALKKFLGSPGAQKTGTALAGALEEASALVHRLNERLDPLLDSLEEVLHSTNGLVQHVDTKVDPLAAGAEGTLAGTRKLVADLDARMGPMADGIDAAVGDARSLLQHVDAGVTPVLDDAAGAARGAREIVDQVQGETGPLLTSARQALDSAHGAMQSAQAALMEVEKTLGKDSVVRAELSGAFRELTTAARSVRVLMELLERQPDALLRGRGTAGGGK